MTDSVSRETDVLVVGAGPTGLVLALWLTKLGARVRIVDKTAEPGTTSRAVAVQARTLELYRQVGLGDTIAERGRSAVAVNLWVAGKNLARAVFGDMGAGLSRYPYALIFPQDEHERLLIDQLAEAGVQVERQTELLGFEDADGRVLAHLVRPEGAREDCEAAYVAGCDGAHSTVRETLGIGFPGGVYAHLFYVADVEASGAAMNGEVHVALDTTDFLAVFPLKGDGRARLIGTVRQEAERQHENLTWDDVSKRVIERMRIDVGRVNWFSIYHVHHRVADHFRKGRAFLLGDAAHIHSPVGGQGMNTGIGDAVNLAWKLAAVRHGRANESLLDSYEPERIAFARRLVRATRRFLFRTVSQTAVNYRGSSLSEGRAGVVHGGDRLPWVMVNVNGVEQDNFAPLTSLDWQLHVYGESAPEIRAVCDERRLPLHVFPWRSETGRTGLRRDTVYLVRPDGYLGLVDPVKTAAAVTSYLDARKIIPRT